MSADFAVSSTFAITLPRPQTSALMLSFESRRAFSLASTAIYSITNIPSDPSPGRPENPASTRNKVRLTLRWREMDSNFQFLD